MAIISVGYGEDISEEAWSRYIARGAGSPYSVVGANDWRVELGAADRELRILPGIGFGWGIQDVVTAEVRIAIPAVTSGSEWYTIAARRDWNAGKTTFVALPGATILELAPRANRPLDIDEQPIAQVLVEAGKSQVSRIDDLRVWSGPGGVLIVDALALGYLNYPGASITIRDECLEYVFNADGALEWRAHNRIDRFERVSELGAGFEHYRGSGWDGLMVARFGGIVTGGGALIKDPGGVGLTVRAGTAIARLPFGYRPGVQLETTSSEVIINDTGQLILTVDAPVGKTVSCSFTFYQRNLGA